MKIKQCQKFDGLLTRESITWLQDVAQAERRTKALGVIPLSVSAASMSSDSAQQHSVVNDPVTLHLLGGIRMCCHPSQLADVFRLRAAMAVRQIAELYRLEKKIRYRLAEKDPPVATTLLPPIVDKLWLWLDQQKEACSESSALGKTINYMLKRRETLSRFAMFRASYTFGNSALRLRLDKKP